MKLTTNLMTQSNYVLKAKRSYMRINVILTFDKSDADGDSQEIFNLNLPINKCERNAVEFLHKKLFHRIAKKCELYNRKKEDLIKISTCADWGQFEEVTKKESLPRLGHECKWFFGKGRSDLDLWEKKISKKYGFGESVDIALRSINSISEASQMRVIKQSAPELNLQ